MLNEELDDNALEFGTFTMERASTSRTSPDLPPVVIASDCTHFYVVDDDSFLSALSSLSVVFTPCSIFGIWLWTSCFDGIARTVEDFQGSMNDKPVEMLLQRLSFSAKLYSKG